MSQELGSLARITPEATQPAVEVRVEQPAPPAPPTPPSPPDPPLPPSFEPITLEPGWPVQQRDRPSDETITIISLGFFFTVMVVAVGLPLVRALSRKWERAAGGTSGGGTSPDVERRLERIEQAVEAIAVEVERVGEGQRYTNQIVHELRALPSGDAARAEQAMLDRAAQAGARERAR